MSFGGSQGTVRYAVMFQDQASPGIQKLQQQFRTMGTEMTTLTQRANTFNTAINTNARTFQASLTPIKNAGNALNQLGIQQKTITSQLSAIGSGFKNNALAIGAAASSVLGLYQNYANLSSAQNNANKSATAAKAAQNNVTTAVKNLNKAIDQYGKGSKEAKAAQDKLTVAQERAVNKTESAKIAQDNLNQTMADFGINILPNILLAGGSVVSIFDNIGKSGSGVTGIISKLSGVFGGIIPSFTAIGSKSGAAIKGILGIGTASSTAAIGVSGLKAALSGMALSLGALIGIPLGGIFAANALGNTFHEFHDIGDQVRKQQLEMAKTLGLTDEQVKQLNESMNAINRLFGIYEPNVKKAAGTTTELSKAEAKLSADEAKLLSLQKERQTIGVKQQEDELKATIALDKAEIARLSTLNKTTKAMTDATGAGGGFFAELSRIGVEDAKLSKNAQDLNTALVDGYQTFLKSDPVVQAFGDTVENLRKKFEALSTTKLAFPAPSPDVLKFLDLLNKGNPTAVTKTAGAYNEEAKSIVNVTNAIEAGKNKFLSSIKTVGEAAITNKVYHDSLLNTIAAQVKIPPALDLTTSQLESMQTALANSKVGLTENANASKILADALDQQLAPSVQTLGKALTALDSKEFKKAFKELDFGAAGKKFKSFASDLDKDISQINKEAGRMNVIFSQLSIALSLDKLPHKQWVAGLEGIRKEVEKIAKTQKIDLSGITAFITKAETIKDPVQLAKYQKVIALINSSAEGGFNATELDAIAKAIAAIGTSSGDAAPEVDKNAAAVKAFGVSSASARGQIDQVTGAVDVLKAAVSSAKLSIPAVDQTTFQKGLQLAIDNANQTVQFIKNALLKVSGIQVPPPNETKYQKGLQLAINNAAQTKQKIDKELQKISSIKVPAPKFNSFNSALDQAVSDTKRAVRDINNALKKINKPSSGGGDGHGPGATTGPFAQGGTVIANQRTTATFGEAGPELAMFVPLKGGGMRSVGSGSAGGGNVEVVNIINIMDETIMRRITARSGRNRFALGV